MNVARSREDLLAHKTSLSRSLFDAGSVNSIHIIMDGTYLYVEISRSHSFQKRTYNSHKKRNYVKVMMGTAPDGFIIFAEGPFTAGENDATITSQLLQKNIPALTNFQPEDVFIVDRGFRDCKTELMNNGYIVKTPACSPSNTQLTTQEANQTRLVTRVRYDIERMNGVVKGMWKLLGQVCESQGIPAMMDDFQIAAALINRSKKSLVQTENPEWIANRMLSRMNLANELSKFVSKDSFKKKISRKEYTMLTDLLIFPQLTMHDLYRISCGPYQIEQAKCYGYDHLEAHGNNFEVFTFSNAVLDSVDKNLLKDAPNAVLVMAQQKSRFVSSSKYRSYVLFDLDGTDYNCILEYCCECKVGKRTVGCCSHVMTIIYYLSFAQYNNGIPKIAKHLDNVFDRYSCENEDCDDVIESS